MNEENQLRVIKLGAGLLLATYYVFTGVDGVIVLLAAFLLGFPLEKYLPARKTE